jgi:hypothetical protein
MWQSHLAAVRAKNPGLSFGEVSKLASSTYSTRGKGKRGKGLIDKGLNLWRGFNCPAGKSRKLLDGEKHYGCHNFTGPGTRIDLPEVKNFKPYNNIDACSKQHDIDYMNNKGNPAGIHEADKKALACYDRYSNENGYIAARAGIGIKAAAEQGLSAVKGTPSTFYGGRRKKSGRRKRK